MQQILNKLDFLLGTSETVENIRKQKPMTPFSEKTVGFLDEISRQIRKLPDIRNYPDVASFGFWCRKASVSRFEKEYSDTDDRLGRGVTLHFAPSNIAVLFAFSMAAGILAGNCCLVRLSSKETPQAKMIAAAITAAFKNGFEDFADRIALFRYEHSKDITDTLSALCDVRVLWGGDNAVSEIRKSPLSPRATELPFADRNSMAVIDASKLMAESDISDMIHGFYNDTYLNDQNACSSPKIIYWLGDKECIKKARDRFWHEVHSYIASRYTPADVVSVSKLETAMLIAALDISAKIEKSDNLITRVWVDSFKSDSWGNTVPGGFFVESGGETLENIIPLLTDICQTICYFGDEKEKIADFVKENGVYGVDRIVPFGSSLEFSLIWDGHDLIEAMSRKISVL